MQEQDPFELALPAERMPPPPPRDPFWRYSDLGIFFGMAIPSLLLALGITRGVFWLLRLHPKISTWELLPAQTLGYLLAFGVLAAIFRMQYGRPFWRSLGWTPSPVSPLTLVIAGIATAFGVNLVGMLIKVPITDNPMKQLLEDPTSLVLVAIFGVTIGPLAEELAFRGFLQPLLVRSLGPIAGILAASIPFGLLHAPEYGFSWRHVVVISLAGAAFGWMRHVTGSTRASTLMHAAYNGLLFAAFFAAKGRVR